MVDLVPPFILTPNLADADFLIIIAYNQYTCSKSYMYMMCKSEKRCVYVRDQLKTWPVLKPSEGFNAGRMASKQARRLRNRPDGFPTCRNYMYHRRL